MPVSSSFVGPSIIEYESIQSLPDELRATTVSQFFVNILDLELEPFDPEKPRSNHFISRLVFEKQIPEDSGIFPGAKQVCIDLMFDGGYACKTSDGYLNVKPYSNTNPSSRSVKQIEIPITAGANVEDFFAVLDKHHMIPCGFNTENWQAKGCRDFTSQFVYRLIQENVLNIPDDEQYELFESFNPSYGPGGQSRERTVAYAAFNGEYHEHHVEINGIQYGGNRISRDSAEGNDPEPEPADVEF
ncbi:hypothetical protein N7540_008243 [Penicillium herquei]|nr:hypothetical protein N7540_008243 [Penicillium herquei]